MKFVPRLITFRLSHYCEKVRWAMDRINFSYIEECHLPLLHRLKTNPLGGSSVPILVTETEVFKDSADIFKYLDTVAPSHLKLYPDLPVLRHEVEKLEARFNRKLGVLIRQWGYFYTIPNRSLIQKLWCEEVPEWEKLLFPILFPVTRRLVYSSYNVNRESAIAAYHKVQKIFAGVSDRLSDGRKYLMGDYFSAADLAFASLSAPGLLPPEYGGVLPELNQLPDEMVEQIQTLRETVAGKYALRLYQEKRYKTHD
ncbi:glutathione S-transferase family protein [Aerosakkonemataceae cyanobacterium BLCC-F50]|uniref:Glutathione S-transferase family protein n=1 Tax=Floridaenema flaviceps BLCC-F50 TaxID=3153642 RepID=A0ABV4XR98_9CYAN